MLKAKILHLKSQLERYRIRHVIVPVGVTKVTDNHIMKNIQRNKTSIFYYFCSRKRMLCEMAKGPSFSNNNSATNNENVDTNFNTANKIFFLCTTARKIDSQYS